MENLNGHNKRAWFVELVVWLFTGPKTYVLLGLFAITVAFYGFENWRGKRAWQQCKRTIEARGRTMDWLNNIPAPIPDELNVLKAPHMGDWFVGRGRTELSSQLDLPGLQQYLSRRGQTNLLAVIAVVPDGATVRSNDVDLVLRYREPML